MSARFFSLGVGLFTGLAAYGLSNGATVVGSFCAAFAAVSYCLMIDSPTTDWE